MSDLVRVRITYFTYLGAVGLFVTYWPWHMSALGIGPAMLGLLNSARTALAIVAQPTVASLADRTGRPLALLGYSMAFVLAVALVLPFVDNTLLFAALILISTPAEAVTIPLLDAVIVRHWGIDRFGAFRAWGSAGYGVVVAGFGLLASTMTFDEAGALAVPAFALFYLVATLALRGVRDPVVDAMESEARPRSSKIAFSFAFVSFLVFNATHYASVSAYNNFLSLHVKALEFAGWVAGAGVGVAITGEVLAFRNVATLRRVFSPFVWLAIVCVVGVVRWELTALAHGSAMLVLAQTAHALSFGLWFAIANAMLGSFAPPERRTTLQGVFIAAVIAGGATVGNLLCGSLMEAFSSAAVFHAAASFEAVALVMLVAFYRRWPAQAAADPVLPPAAVEMATEPAR